MGKGKRKRLPAGQQNRTNLNESSESIDFEIPLIISPSNGTASSVGSDSEFEVNDPKKKLGKADESSDEEEDKLEIY